MSDFNITILIDKIEYVVTIKDNVFILKHDNKIVKRDKITYKRSTQLFYLDKPCEKNPSYWIQEENRVWFEHDCITLFANSKKIKEEFKYCINHRDIKYKIELEIVPCKMATVELTYLFNVFLIRGHIDGVPLHFESDSIYYDEKRKIFVLDGYLDEQRGSRGDFRRLNNMDEFIDHLEQEQKHRIVEQLKQRIKEQQQEEQQQERLGGKKKRSVRRIKSMCYGRMKRKSRRYGYR
jgi:hypothetical protein